MEVSKPEFVSILNLGVDVIHSRLWYMQHSGQLATASQDHKLTIWTIDWHTFTRIDKHVVLDAHEDIVTAFYEVSKCSSDLRRVCHFLS